MTGAQHFWIWARAAAMFCVLLAAGFSCLAIGWTGWHHWWERLLTYGAFAGAGACAVELVRRRSAGRRP